LVLPAAVAWSALAGVRPARGQQPVLGEAELVAARAQLLRTDSAHGRATAVEGLGAGFVRFLADDAVYLEPGADHLRGKVRVQAFLAQHGSGQTLRFHPALAEVSRDGAVGYTVGWTMLTRAGADSVRHGKYISFWRRQPDGSWRVEAWNRSGAQAAPAAPPDMPGSPASRFRGSRSVDQPEMTRKLMAVDSAFAATSVAQGTAEAFYRYAAADALELGGGTDFVVGRDAIRRQQAADAAPGQTLDWKPVVGGVGPLGDLGWTVGEYRFTVPSAGATATFTGKYITIWAKQGDGTWRFVADGGSSSTPPPR
jgi:ketosteroid isomerase-like protein